MIHDVSYIIYHISFYMIYHISYIIYIIYEVDCMIWYAKNLVVNTRGREFILYDHHYDPKHPHHLVMIVFNMRNVFLCIKTYQSIVADFLSFFKKDFPPPQPVTQPGEDGRAIIGSRWILISPLNLIRCVRAGPSKKSRSRSQTLKSLLLNENKYHLACFAARRLIITEQGSLWNMEKQIKRCMQTVQCKQAAKAYFKSSDRSRLTL